MIVEAQSFTLCCSETGYIYQGRCRRGKDAEDVAAAISESLRTLEEASDNTVVITASNTDISKALENYSDFTALVDIKFFFAGSEETSIGTLLVYGSEWESEVNCQIINKI